MVVSITHALAADDLGTVHTDCTALVMATVPTHPLLEYTKVPAYVRLQVAW